MMPALGSNLVVLIASLALGFWLSLAAKHHMPVIVFAQIGLFFVLVRVLWRNLRGLSIGTLVLVGGVIGFVSAIGAAAISELLIRGFDGFFSRDFTPNLYFYPIVSLAWLYGMVVLAVMAGSRN